MTTNSNSIVTPLVCQAINLNRLIFKYVYPYPLKIVINKGNVNFTVDKSLKFKYIPFFFVLILITFIFGFGSCVLVQIIERYKHSSKIDVMTSVFLLYLAACAFSEPVTYFMY